MEVVLFKDTSTIFQLAFGLNLVAGMWIKNFSAARELVWDKYISTISEIVPEKELESKNLYKALETLFPDFKTMTNYCLLIVGYSAVTVFLCFVALLNAVILPEKIINPYMFIFMSSIILIFNPILYYWFNSYYKSRLSLNLLAIERYTKEDPQGNILIAEGHDNMQDLKNLNKEIRSTLLSFKFMELKLSLSEIYVNSKEKLKTICRKIT